MLFPSETTVTMSEDQDEMALTQEMKKSIPLPPDKQLTSSDIQGEITSYKYVPSADIQSFEKCFQLSRKDEQFSCRPMPLSFSSILRKPRCVLGRREKTIVNFEYYEDPPEYSLQEVVNENGHKFNMTEGDYNLWKDMLEELNDKLIQIITENAKVVGRLRSEARQGKAKAASPASQEHPNLETGGSSSTAQNEPAPNHQSLPVGGDHQVRNVQVNGSMNQTVNYAPESSDMESGTSSTQADNEPPKHTNLETGGGSSTAQNEPPPNHQSLPVGGDHQVRNVQVNGSMNQTFHYAPESSDMESGTPSTQEDNEPARDNCGHETMFMMLAEIISIALAVTSVKKSAGEMPIEAKIFLYFLIVCIFVGIISLPYGLCLSGGGGGGRRSIVARVLNAVSYVATGLAVVTAAGLQLPNQVMFWVIPLVCAIVAPAIVCYAMKH